MSYVCQKGMSGLFKCQSDWHVVPVRINCCCRNMSAFSFGHVFFLFFSGCVLCKQLTGGAFLSGNSVCPYFFFRWVTCTHVHSHYTHMRTCAQWTHSNMQAHLHAHIIICTWHCFLPWLREPGNQAVDEIYYCNETVDPSFVFISTTTTKSKQNKYNIQRRRRKRIVAANTPFVLKCVLDFVQGTVVSCINFKDGPEAMMFLPAPTPLQKKRSSKWGLQA